MIRTGSINSLPSGPIAVTADVLERIAYKSGRHIELSPTAAYLTIGRTTYKADLPAADVTR